MGLGASVRVGDDSLIDTLTPILFDVLVRAGLFLRDRRLCELVPLRT